MTAKFLPLVEVVLILNYVILQYCTHMYVQVEYFPETS